MGNDPVSMEGFVKSVFILALSFMGFTCSAATKVQMIKYLSIPWGHVHQNQSRYSASMTTVSCGHPLKVLETGEDWHKVVAGPYTGFIQSGFLSEKKPNCY